MHVFFLFVALAVFSRSPAAFDALRSLGILNLPCDRTLKAYMDKKSSPGIDENTLRESSKKYEEHVDAQKVWHANKKNHH